MTKKTKKTEKCIVCRKPGRTDIVPVSKAKKRVVQIMNEMIDLDMLNELSDLVVEAEGIYEDAINDSE